MSQPTALQAPQQVTRRRATPNRSKQAGHTVVAVVGLGYVGLPTAIALRGAGCRIVGIDVSRPPPERHPRTARPSCWPPSSAICAATSRATGSSLTNRIKALDAADLVLICVPTPVDEQQRPDPRILREACASVVRHARPGQTIVLTSTSYVGTTRELLVQPLAERGLSVGEDVFVAFAPERIDPGVSEHAQLKTPRVLGGVTEECCARAAARAAPHLRARAPRLLTRGGGAREALREHLPRCQHRARLRARRSLPRARPGPDRGDRGRRHQALRLPAPLPLRRRGGSLHRGGPLLPARRPARARAARQGGGGGAAQGRRPPAPCRLAGPRSARGPGAAVAAGAGAARRCLLQARRRRHPRGARTGDHRAPARRGGRSGLPRPAGRNARGGRGAAERGGPRPAPRPLRRRAPRSYDLAILTTLHPDHDYDWLERCPAVLDCTYRRPTAGLLRFTP